MSETMTKRKGPGRPPASGENTQVRLPSDLKRAAASSAEALDTTMSNLIAVCLGRVQREEGLAAAYVRELTARVEEEK